MAQQFRLLAVLPEEPSLVPSTHVRLLTATWTSSSTGSATLLWAAQASSPHTDIHTYIQFKKSKMLYIFKTKCNC